VEESKGGDGGGGAVGDGPIGAACLTQDQRRCLRWIQDTIVAAPGVPLSPSQLRQLLDVVGCDEVPLGSAVLLWGYRMACRNIRLLRWTWDVVSQALAQTVMLVGAMTRHYDVVAWCIAHTTARPWVSAKAFVCFSDPCCAGPPAFALSHQCCDSTHTGFVTSAVLAASMVGDLELLQQLRRDHSDFNDRMRGDSSRNQVKLRVFAFASMTQ
jgi:hypothetical protein